jgi:hypothetical protein
MPSLRERTSPDGALPLDRRRAHASHGRWHNGDVADRDDLIDDYKQFTREMLLRFERAMRAERQEMRAERREWRAELKASREESRSYFESIWAEIREHRRQTDELIEENRAQRHALFRILDRLDGGGTAPAT